jgi:hypothetical protein
MANLPNVSLNNPQTAPATLTLGTAAWKAFDFFANVDFLLSIESKTFMTMFDFFANYGWGIILIVGGIWWYASTKYAPTPRIEPRTVAVIAFLAFLWGVIITVHATGKVPKVIVGYGSLSSGSCFAKVNMERLQSFAKDYEIALICGIEDQTVDKLADPNISVSTTRTIRQGIEDIRMPLSEKMRDKSSQMFRDAGNKPIPIGTWYEAVLLPKTVFMPSIQSLRDVVVHGGKIIHPSYFDYKPPK